MLQKQPKLSTQNGKPITTSVQISEFYDKPHWDVMNVIKEFLTLADEEFGRKHFFASSYQNSQNKTFPCFILTRSGFAAIALAFTGKKAIDFRIAYINRFDEMEAKLQSKAIEKVRAEYQMDRWLPGIPGRDSATVSFVIKNLRYMRKLPEMTANIMKRMLERGELEGFKNKRGHWEIYDDQVTKLLGGQNDE